jgi:hypothetical protein
MKQPVIVLSLCVAFAAGCKSKSESADHSPAPAQPSTAPTPPPAPEATKPVEAKPAEAKLAEAAPSGRPSGLVELDGKAEHYPDGTVCCWYEADGYVIAPVRACFNFAPLSRCGDVKAANTGLDCQKLCKLGTSCKNLGGMSMSDCVDDCTNAAQGARQRTLMNSPDFYKCMNGASDCAATTKCTP